MHEQIEAEEEARERRFQGIPEGTPSNLNTHDHDHPAPPEAADTQSEPQIPGAEPLVPEASMAAHPHDDQQAFGVPEPPLSQPSKLPIRETPPEKLPPEIKYGKAAAEGRSKSEWGQGEDGYKRPKTAADKMRKNLPYKVCTFSSWSGKPGMLTNCGCAWWTNSTSSGVIGAISRLSCMFISPAMSILHGYTCRAVHRIYEVNIQGSELSYI
jgi:hypothetical protein